jgi:uncharacterized protein with HEPN domain
MHKNDSVRLRHMLDAARNAVMLTRGRTRPELDAELTLSLSLVRLLEIIGEAARAVTLELREEHAEIPWPKITSMRNRLIHGYWNVNLDVVWETVQDDLPSLIARLETILQQEPEATCQ